MILHIGKKSKIFLPRIIISFQLTGQRFKKHQRMFHKKLISSILFSMKLNLFLDQEPTQYHQSSGVKNRIKNGALIRGFSLNKINRLKWGPIVRVLYSLILLLDTSWKRQLAIKYFLRIPSLKPQKKICFLDQAHTQQLTPGQVKNP